MKRLMICLNAVLAAVLCIGNYLLLSAQGGASKAFCSGCFVFMGVLNGAYALLKGGKRGYAAMMAAGLVLAMAGDLRINQSFVQGAALFAAGHICFWLAGIILRKMHWPDLAGFAAVFVPAAVWMLASDRLTFAPAYLMWVCIGYALIIALMTGKALGNFLRFRDLLTGTMLAGSLLFCFSDLMLMLGRFGTGGGAYGIWCMSTYYPAQILLAHSVFYAAD